MLLFHLVQAIIYQRMDFCSGLRVVLGRPGWKRCQTGTVRAKMLKKGSDLAGCQSGIFQQLEEIEENRIEMQLPALLTLPAPCSRNILQQIEGKQGENGQMEPPVF